MLQSLFAALNFPFSRHIVNADTLKYVPLIALNNIWLVLLTFVPGLKRHYEQKNKNKKTSLKLLHSCDEKSIWQNKMNQLQFRDICSPFSRLDG